MTHDNEEKMIFDSILTLRERVLTLEQRKRVVSEQLATEKQRLEEAQQALADYYKAHGIYQSEIGDYRITLGHSTSVDCPDIDAVPEKYIRTKITKEINKALIRAERVPESNWLQYDVTDKLTIKHKDA